MTFKINGVEPTIIDVVYEKTGEKTTLNSLGTNTTNVWGKPYSLSLNSGPHSTIVVTRISSPNQGASIGVLSSGSVIYHGDTLVIYGAAGEGYKLDTFTVNGVNWTPSDTITVTGAISVVATAVADASWHTVWSGSRGANLNAESYIDITGAVSNAQKTRVTFTSGITYTYEDYNTGDYDYSGQHTMIEVVSKEINCGFTADWNGIKNTFEGQSSSYTPISDIYFSIYKIEGNRIYFKKQGHSYEDGDGWESMQIYYILKLTKVEQYY